MPTIAQKGFLSDDPEDAQGYGFRVEWDTEMISRELGYYLEAEFTLIGQIRSATLDLCIGAVHALDDEDMEILEDKAAAAQAMYASMGDFLLAVLDARKSIYDALDRTPPELPSWTSSTL